ncbi:hypothetical protein ACFL3Q_10830 [Planctomycetota bacterium]
MAYNRTAEMRELYFQQSQYSVDKPEDPSYDSLLQWPSNGYFDKFRSDAVLLKQTLTSYANPQASTVAAQVFGIQAREQRIGLQQKSNVLYERAFLHSGHLKEIDRCLMNCYERLSILKMHFPLDGGRTQQNLEKTVLQLEQERRTEEINFWKDSAEIREKLFEDAGVYSATRRRENMLLGVEG